ncbi:MAG: HepT-like ribonuclease domain-containing protein [Thermomicrobiales bacterium]
MTQHDDVLYLGHMLDMARKARDIAQPVSKDQYDANDTLQLALARLVQNIGEAARRVSAERKAAHPAISWHRIVGMRHRLVHDYGNVDTGIVWQTVSEDLPILIEMLEKIVPPNPPE